MKTGGYNPPGGLDKSLEPTTLGGCWRLVVVVEQAGDDDDDDDET